MRWAQNQILTYEAEEAASTWGIFLRSNLADLDRILEGGSITDDDMRVIESARKAGNVFRYKIFDRNGVIVHATRPKDHGKTNTKPYFANLVRNGKMFAKIKKDEQFGNERQVVSEAYVPIMVGGQVRGAIEVYVDVTTRAQNLANLGKIGFLGLVALLAALGAVMGIVVSRNITGHKRAVEANALRVSDERFRAFYDNSPSSMTLKDMDSRFLLVNKRFEEWFGFSQEEAFGKTALELFPAEFVDDFVEQDSETLDRNALTEHERETRFVDGSKRSIVVTKFPIFVDGDRPIGIGTIQSDITKRKRAERTLKESEQRFGAFIDNSPAAILIKDVEGRYLVANRRWHKWFNPSGREILGKTVFDFYPEEHAREVIESDRHVVETKTPLEVEMDTPFADGTSRTTLLQKFPIIDSKGEITAIGGMNTDITEFKSMEVQLRQAQKMKAVGQLTGGIAHDFNNLLAIILGNAELLKARLGDDGELAEEVIEAANRGAELTHQLLAFSRRQPLKPKVIDLNALISGMTGLIRRALGETIRIETRAAADLWNIEADPGQVENVLLNLAINARDAMSDGGSLVIETANVTLEDDHGGHVSTAPGDYAMLAVTDTGSGMPPEVLERVFEPFFTTKEVGKGSGLGLSMVYGFSKQSGGYVAIESEEGVYTTAMLLLPRTTGRHLSVAQEAEKGEPVARGETVLLVEDEAKVRKLTARLLGTLGYAVIEASDGDSAVAAMESAIRVDLLLTDVVLPGAMSGPQIAKEARRRNPGVKALFMSGYTSEVLHHHDLSGVEVLGKPFPKRELAQKVRSALDSRIDA
ncbi:MAG: PAS domain-containing protein [Planctomycetota bacterium]|nr:PAS domain-containing protein [Planctomycetota bacterium]